MGEEGQRPPGAVFQLLENSTNMRIRSINCESKSCLWGRMRKRNRCHQGGFGRGKRRGGGGEPLQGFWVAPEEVRKRLECFCDCRQETPIEVYQAQKLLELFDVLWRRNS